jgi:hypothetical protein
VYDSSSNDNKPADVNDPAKAQAIIESNATPVDEKNKEKVGSLDAAGSAAAEGSQQSPEPDEEDPDEDEDEDDDDYNYRSSSQKDKIGVKRGNTPRINTVQNAQSDAVAAKLGLTKDQAQLLHKLIGKQGYGYKEILKFAKLYFKK